jgi:hypothetical protein
VKACLCLCLCIKKRNIFQDWKIWGLIRRRVVTINWFFNTGTCSITPDVVCNFKFPRSRNSFSFSWNELVVYTFSVIHCGFYNGYNGFCECFYNCKRCIRYCKPYCKLCGAYKVEIHFLESVRMFDFVHLLCFLRLRYFGFF